MEQVQRIDAIKERMRNRDEGANAQANQNAPAPVPAAPPAPVQEPEAPVQPVPATPDPALVEAQAVLETREAEIKRLTEEANQREQEIKNLLALAEKKAQLPSATELDEMSQGEAVLAVAEATMARQDQQLQAVVSDLNRTVVKPTLEKVGKLDLQGKRDIAAKAYPEADMNKYGSAFDKMAKQYPDMPAPQVLKAVADPRDLSTAQGTPTTPAATVQPAGAHMETGVSAHGSAAHAANAPQAEPTVQDHLVRAEELRRQGDRYGADKARQAGIAKRLTDQGVLRG